MIVTAGCVTYTSITMTHICCFLFHRLSCIVGTANRLLTLIDNDSPSPFSLSSTASIPTTWSYVLTLVDNIKPLVVNPIVSPPQTIYIFCYYKPPMMTPRGQIITAWLGRVVYLRNQRGPPTGYKDNGYPRAHGPNGFCCLNQRFGQGRVVWSTFTTIYSFLPSCFYFGRYTKPSKHFHTKMIGMSRGRLQLIFHNCRYVFSYCKQN